MERNFFVNIKKGTAFKNSDYYKHNPKPNLDKKTLSNTVIFILYKDLGPWIKSLERNPMDFFEINKLFNHNISNTKEVEKIKQYHKNFYNFWIEQKNFFQELNLLTIKKCLMTILFITSPNI